MEIQVGDYVRFKNGQIRKVEGRDSDKHILLDKGYNYARYLTKVEEKEDIVKHSKNIIDLVEVGDYINGVKIEEIFQVSHKHNSIIINNEEELLEEEIKSIVTYQSFKQVEYEV